ncbi:Transglutaminase-like superfamily protein [Oceanobacillus limi]|uniref:Transglutaminase-like superfamily protein n=1 Tax=Oceanobacillus limi TaxID=930131 RepID=A0A1I0FCC5_9BACI|nr:transglutaminase-like domain-containing protein [Oceanobacillus limi]SET54852.1 Transglutaminase-like superfamily protein [Oceanobacillus limi]
MKKVIVLFVVAILLVGCQKEEEQPIDKSSDNPKEQEAVADIKSEVSAIQFSNYAEEVGFSLRTPSDSTINAQNTVQIQGEIENTAVLSDDEVWIVVTPESQIEELKHSEFNYYLPIKSGEFAKEISMHNGLGEYQVSIRLPGSEAEDEGSYVEAANFTVNNQSEDIQREVEYTKYGVEQELELIRPEQGLNELDQSIYVEGVVPKDYGGEMVLVQVEREGENRQVMLPVKDGLFTGDIPLYFGKGNHLVRIQLYNEEDGLYYDSAMFYARNQSESAFAEMEAYRTYTDRGITLQDPSWDTVNEWDELEYPIKGEIDPDTPGADEITHIIVMVNHVGEGEESGYLVPVENYQFEGNAYFRFGPGEYEVTVNVPSMEQHDQSMFYFESVVKVGHQVAHITDQRDLLPSRGIESDHPEIIQKAEEITAGIHGEREKAKAIYEFVAQHVAYDVEKAEKDIFDIGDSALTTLESGIGICQDYAFLATALLRAIGMEAHYVEGYAGERHAWVEVKTDGKWIEMDPTWGAGYIQDGTFHFNYNEDYFDPAPSFFAETHTREGIMY